MIRIKSKKEEVIETISGVVLHDNELLESVNIFNKTTNKETISRANGSYVIKGSTGDKVLAFYLRNFTSEIVLYRFVISKNQKQ